MRRATPLQSSFGLRYFRPGPGRSKLGRVSRLLGLPLPSGLCSVGGSIPGLGSSREEMHRGSEVAGPRPRASARPGSELQGAPLGLPKVDLHCNLPGTAGPCLPLGLAEGGRLVQASAVAASQMCTPRTPTAPRLASRLTWGSASFTPSFAFTFAAARGATHRVPPEKGRCSRVCLPAEEGERRAPVPAGFQCGLCGFQHC